MKRRVEKVLHCWETGRRVMSVTQKSKIQSKKDTDQKGLKEVRMAHHKEGICKGIKERRELREGAKSTHREEEKFPAKEEIPSLQRKRRAQLVEPEALKGRKIVTNKMKTNEPSVEAGQVLNQQEEKKSESTGNVADQSTGPWRTEEITVDIEEFPAQEQNPPLHYPHDIQKLKPKSSESYPLSAKAFIYAGKNLAPYFGSLADGFDPLLPHRPDNTHHLSLLKMPTFSENNQRRVIAVRQSRVTKKPYLFELDKMRGSIWCYGARHPTPGVQFEAFNILTRVGPMTGEVDSSNAPDFDFEILYYKQRRKELFFVQVDLRKRETRTKEIELPSEYAGVQCMMSTQLLIFWDEDKNFKIYDLVSRDVSDFHQIMDVRQLGSTVYFTKQDEETKQVELRIFDKKSRKFHFTHLEDVPHLVAEQSQFIFIMGKYEYYIFTMQEDGPECIHQAPYSRNNHKYFVTTRYLLEYREQQLIRCVQYNLLLQNSSKLDQELFLSKEFDSLDDWAVIGHLNERDLAHSKTKGFFLLSRDAPPQACLCFQNEALTEITPPLLIQVEEEGHYLFLLWDGSSLKDVGNLDFHIDDLLWITSEEITDENEEHTTSSKIGDDHWGVIMDNTFTRKLHLFHRQYRWPPFFQREQSLLGEFLMGVVRKKMWYHFLIGGEKYSFHWEAYDRNYCAIKDKDGAPFQTICITLRAIKQVSEVRGTVMVELKEGGTFRVEHFKLRRPLVNGYRFQFENFKYEAPSGAEGVLLLVPVNRELSTRVSSSIEDLINSYLFLKAHGVELQLKVEQRKDELILEKDILDQEYELIESAGEKEYFQEMIQNKKGQLYLKVENCREAPLIFFTLMEFGSLEEMDAILSEGRFMSALAKRVASGEDKRIMIIFQEEIALLHLQADNIGMSLASFYEATLEEVEEIYQEAPDREIYRELEDDNIKTFKEVLTKRGKKQKRHIKIFRSGFKLPPSNDPTTRQLTEQLSNTQDLAIFETKLIQIYLQKRWKRSLRFFFLDYSLLLTSLFFLFLYSAFIRSPFILIPVLVIQFWNLGIESIEINNKGWRAYLSDFWNYFDILRFIFAFTYFAVDVADGQGSSSDDTHKTVLLTLLSFFQSVKAFHIFSIFKSTRVLLRIVIEIVKDMIPFMIFVIATTITVSLLFTSATPDAALKDVTYTQYLLHVYRLDFGDFDIGDYSGLDLAIFILAVIIVPLVFLNMLIAIMGDTFDRVKEEQGRRDFQELAGLIYRYEVIAQTICKWLKRKSAWKYIFVSEDVKYSGEESIDVWKGRIKGIKLEIEKSQKKQEEWQRQYTVDQEKNEEWKKKQEDRYKADQKEHREWRKQQEEKLKGAQKEDKEWKKKTEELLSEILEQIKEVSASDWQNSKEKEQGQENE